MPALYTHTSRATGTTLTADIYNTDHQNHITNGDAAGLGGHSTNATQMQATTDPGEVSSENLAASVADEIERLRFIVKEMKGAAQWYISAVTRNETLAWGGYGTTSGVAPTTSVLIWPDGVNETRFVSFRLPEAWASGNLIFTFYLRASATGTAVMNYSSFRLRDSTAVTTLDNGTAANFVAADTNTHAVPLTISTTGAVVGDLFRVDLQRIGLDGGDTLAGTVTLDGAAITYTAYAGRP